METTALTTQQIAQLRAETKGTTNKIHFNNAGASLPPDVVVDTVISYLQDEALIGGYEAEAKYKDRLDAAYTSIAQLINAEAEEIAIVENASTAWGLAFNGLTFKPGDEIITSEMEYVTNVIGFVHAEKTQAVNIILIPNDEQGNFSLLAFEQAITPKTKLIAITHIGSSTGGMMPIVEIGKIARRHSILYLLDACQSAGHTPLDVKQIGCDMLSVTGRKYLRAPRGTGFLFVRKEVQNDLKLLFADGFTMQSVSANDYKPKDSARRFELYEKNRALILGLGKAVDYILNIGMDKIWQRIQHLSSHLRQQLNSINGITVHDMGDEQCGIVTFTVKGINSAEIKNRLTAKNINTSVGLDKSTLYFMNKHHLTSVVRASIHYYNTEEEIKIMCDELRSYLA